VLTTRARNDEWLNFVRSLGLGLRDSSHDWHVQPVVKDRITIRLSGVFQSNPRKQTSVKLRCSVCPRKPFKSTANHWLLSTLIRVAGNFFGSLGSRYVSSGDSAAARRSAHHLICLRSTRYSALRDANFPEAQKTGEHFELLKNCSEV